MAALNKLGLRPLVDLDLRLGEGTGALLALPVVQSAARAMHEVATFDSAGCNREVAPPNACPRIEFVGRRSAHPAHPFSRPVCGQAFRLGVPQALQALGDGTGGHKRPTARRRTGP